MYAAGGSQYFAPKKIGIAAFEVGNHAPSFLHQQSACRHVVTVEIVLKITFKPAACNVSQVEGGGADAGAPADELSVRNGDEAAALAAYGANAEEAERSAASAEEAALSSLQAEGRAVLQSYIEEAAQLRTERGGLRGELLTAAVAFKVASVSAPLIAC